MLLAALSLFSSEAQAYSFFMVGYGPTISTNVLSLQISRPENGSIMNNYGELLVSVDSMVHGLIKIFRANVDGTFNRFRL